MGTIARLNTAKKKLAQAEQAMPGAYQNNYTDSINQKLVQLADASLTGSTGGQWMLAAMGENGYTAYTRPGSYDCYAILPIDDDAEELPPSLYEQFVARVLSELASTRATGVLPSMIRAMFWL